MHSIEPDNAIKKVVGYGYFSTSDAKEILGDDFLDEGGRMENFLRSRFSLWRRFNERYNRWIWRYNAIYDIASAWVTSFGSRALTTRELLKEVMSEPVFSEDLTIRDIIIHPKDPLHWGKVSSEPVSVDRVFRNLQDLWMWSHPFNHTNAPSHVTYQLQHEVRDNIDYWSMVHIPLDEDIGYPALNRFLEAWERLYGVGTNVSIADLEGAGEAQFKAYLMDWIGDLQVRFTLDMIAGTEVNGRRLSGRARQDVWFLERTEDSIENYSGSIDPSSTDFEANWLLSGG